MSSVYAPDFRIRLDNMTIAKCSKKHCTLRKRFGYMDLPRAVFFVTNNLMFAVGRVSRPTSDGISLFSVFVLAFTFGLEDVGLISF